MALLRNRPVTILGPTGAEASPIFTVEYQDGTREDTQLKFIEMSESEQKEWAKSNPQYADHVRVISDKDHQAVLDSQNPDKIKKSQDKQPDRPVQVPVLVNPSDVNQAKAS